MQFQQSQRANSNKSSVELTELTVWKLPLVPEEVADFDILFSPYARAKANKTQSTVIYSLCICRSFLQIAAEISLPLAQAQII